MRAFCGVLCFIVAVAANASVSSYARSEGISHAEASRRMRVRKAMDGLIERLREVHKERLAGIVLDHKPIYRLRVRLTGNAPVAAQRHVLGGSELPVVFDTGARATVATLRASLVKNQAALKEIFPTLAGALIDERTSEIVIEVHAPTPAAADVARGALPQVVARLGVPARIELAEAYPSLLVDVFGGAKVAPNPIARCTAGFVVTNGAVTGISTNAHCDNNLTYYAPNVVATLTLVAGTEYRDADQDVQIHTSAENEVAAFFWDDNKTSLEYVDDYRSRAQTAVGDYVCHRGEASGFSCGYVQSTSYAPNISCGGQTCDPVYVRLDPGSAGLECQPGDSGGPTFHESVAYGILVGGSFNANNQCFFAYYMSLDFLPPNWSLAYY